MAPLPLHLRPPLLLWFLLLHWKLRDALQEDAFRVMIAGPCRNNGGQVDHQPYLHCVTRWRWEAM